MKTKMQEVKTMKNLKIILVTFCSTFFVLILITGFVIVENNTRKIMLGDYEPIVTCEYEKNKLRKVKFHLMGKDLEIKNPC